MVETSIASIPNFLQLSESVATAGQPTEAQIAAIQAAGYSVVINLALPSSTDALPNEQALVEAQGMTYIHIPVVWEEPTLVDVQQFFSAMPNPCGTASVCPLREEYARFGVYVSLSSVVRRC
jgi:protein tyrosine phosphatase (PTP) superfamily phosphohydrolase (DUF442 family)